MGQFKTFQMSQLTNAVNFSFENNSTTGHAPKRKALPDIFTTFPAIKNTDQQLFNFDIETENQLIENQDDTKEFDPSEKNINPHMLGFAPFGDWKSQYVSLHDIRRLYFSRRNGAARHFHYKLYNAVKITEKYPSSYSIVGVMLIGKNLVKVNSVVFGSLLGIRAYQGGLFHKQGNFVRNGYKQILRENIDPSVLMKKADITDVDDYEVRIFSKSTDEI